MSLPGVYIEILNGQLGSVAGTDDGKAALIATGVAVTGKIALNEAIALFSLAEAEELGINEAYDTANGCDVYGQIKDFYSEAGTGAELWLMIVGSGVPMAEMLDITEADHAVKLLNAAGGTVRLLAVSKSGTGASVAGGLDADFFDALAKAQELAEAYAEEIKPLCIIVPAREFTGTVGDLVDLHTFAYNRVSAVLLSTGDGIENAAVGLVLGRLASIPVQRNIGRVKSGALPVLEAYLTDGVSVEDHENILETIHNKGYIIGRKYVGKSGYYFNDDPTATALTDDYNSIARGRVIDKALVLTYSTYTDEVNDEVPINADGTLSAAYVKALQGKIENVINQAMTAESEISSVACTIDPLQNILSTNRLEIEVLIIPVGYAKEIRVRLGFTNPLNQQ